MKYRLLQKNWSLKKKEEKKKLFHISLEVSAKCWDVPSRDGLPGPGRLRGGLRCCHGFLSCCTRSRYSGSCSKQNNDGWGVFAVLAMRKLPMCTKIILSNMLWLGIVVRADNCWVLCIMHNRQGCGMLIKKAWDGFCTQTRFSECAERMKLGHWESPSFDLHAKS